jgi:fibronectin-binding autotransporter adhesin
VGYEGLGALNITGGGTVSNRNGYIGKQSGGNGTVTVGGGTGSATWTNSGTLTVGSSGTGTLSIKTGGTVSAAALDAGNATSAINLNGGTLRITVTNSASNKISLLSGGGTFDTPTASTAFTITSAISGAGGLTKTGVAKLALTGTNTYAGNTTVSGGTLALVSSGSLANSPTISIASGTTLDVSSLTGGANFSGGRFSLASGQTLKGSGTIVGSIRVASGATIVPSNSVDADTPEGSPGILSIQGDYTQDGTGNLAIQIGGTTPGSTGYDVLSVTGAVTVAGTLTVAGTSAGGVFFAPTVGQSFDILTPTAGVSGAFSSTSSQWVADGELVHYSTTYSANKVTLQVTSIDPLIAGDYTGGGSVDAANYLVWRKTLASHLSAADGDHSGTIDAGDYSVWRANFGNVAAGGSSSATLASVPEPPTLWMLPAGILMMCLVDARQCRKLSTP